MFRSFVLATVSYLFVIAQINAQVIPGVQSPVANPPTTLGPSMTLPIIQQIQSGKTDFFTYNGSEVDLKKLNEIFKQRQEDRDFYLNSINGMKLAFIEFSRHVFNDKGGLYDLSINQSGQGKIVSVTTFLQARQKYLNARMDVVAKIESFRAIPNGMFPSQVKLARTNIDNQQEQVTDLPPIGNINFDEIVKFYEGKLTEIDNTLDGLEFSVENVQGVPYKLPPRDLEKPAVPGTIYGTNLTVKFPFVLTNDELQKKNDQINSLREMKRTDKERIASWQNYVKSRLQQFIFQYGTSERYRGRTNWKWDELTSDVKELQELFFASSYLRQRFGSPLGVIPVYYKKSWFHLDAFFGNKNAQLADFGETILWDDNDVKQVYDSVLEALQVLKERTTRLTQAGRLSAAQKEQAIKIAQEEDALSRKILEQGDVTLLARGNSLITYLVGNRNLADVLLYTMRLFAADLYEENLVRKANGHEQMHARFERRYFSSQPLEDQKYYVGLLQNYAKLAETGQSGGRFRNVGVGGQNVTSAFNTAKMQCAFVGQKMMQADAIEAELQNYLLPDATKENDDDILKKYGGGK